MIRTHLQLLRSSSTFVTSPIFYANAEPHIGHAFTAVLCDTAYRWNKLKNPDGTAIFSIGTDEHGTKIFQASQKSSTSPKLFCDQVSSKFSTLFRNLNLSHTHFIRTTDAAHVEAVQHFWLKLQQGDHIYKSTYSGFYSITDESFITEDCVESREVNGKKEYVLKSTGTSVEWIEEENYMFRLSAFRDEVKKWITTNDVVHPAKYTSLALDSLDMKEDLSVSRSRKRLSWGIPVPGDDSQTIYVWLDALVNYLTVSGYPQNKVVWPPTCQVIGKDIVKFHLFYWPAFLMAANIQLPQKFFVHGHWLVDNVKMSKSLGNVVNPQEAIEKFTSEGLRYFLLKQGNPSSDCSFSWASCLETVNSDLVNNVGNLLNRSTVSKINKNGMYPSMSIDEVDLEIKEEAKKLLKMIDELETVCTELYEQQMFYKVIEQLMLTMKEGNRVFQATQPWKEKNDQKLQSLLYIIYETLRIVSILLQPVTPQMSMFSFERLGIQKSELKLENAKFGKYRGGSIGKDAGVFIDRIQK